MSRAHLASGDNGTSCGRPVIMLGCQAPAHYQMPRVVCAHCGHVVRHPEADELRRLAREHHVGAHADKGDI